METITEARIVNSLDLVMRQGDTDARILLGGFVHNGDSNPIDLNLPLFKIAHCIICAAMNKKHLDRGWIEDAMPHAWVVETRTRYEPEPAPGDLQGLKDWTMDTRRRARSPIEVVRAVATFADGTTEEVDLHKVLDIGEW